MFYNIVSMFRPSGLIIEIVERSTLGCQHILVRSQDRVSVQRCTGSVSPNCSDFKERRNRKYLFSGTYGFSIGDCTLCSRIKTIKSSLRKGEVLMCDFFKWCIMHSEGVLQCKTKNECKRLNNRLNWLKVKFNGYIGLHPSLWSSSVHMRLSESLVF